MSNTPYYVAKARLGFKFGDQTLVDGIVKDGLTDAKHNDVMGIAAEKCADKYQFTRQQQVL
jgi:acetyl-CoA C-acetyltransferase